MGTLVSAHDWLWLLLPNPQLRCDSCANTCASGQVFGAGLPRPGAAPCHTRLGEPPPGLGALKDWGSAPPWKGSLEAVTISPSSTTAWQGDMGQLGHPAAAAREWELWEKQKANALPAVRCPEVSS